MVSAIHRVLVNSDIMSNVVQRLQAQGDRPCATLLTFGLLCRATYEDAMNALWHTVSDLEQLSCLFPYLENIRDLVTADQDPCMDIHWGHCIQSCPFDLTVRLSPLKVCSFLYNFIHAHSLS